MIALTRLVAKRLHPWAHYLAYSSFSTLQVTWRFDELISCAHMLVGPPGFFPPDCTQLLCPLRDILRSSYFQTFIEQLRRQCLPLTQGPTEKKARRHFSLTEVGGKARLPSRWYFSHFFTFIFGGDWTQTPRGWRHSPKPSERDFCFMWAIHVILVFFPARHPCLFLWRL